MFSAAIVACRSTLSYVPDATCGVSATLAAESRGLTFSIGSGSTTSAPQPPRQLPRGVSPSGPERPGLAFVLAPLDVR